MTTSKRGPVPGSEEAKHGGQAVREKYGLPHYRKMGQKGGQTVLKKHGPEHYAKMGRKGGESTRLRGPEFYAEIGKKGGERSKRPKATVQDSKS